MMDTVDNSQLVSQEVPSMAKRKRERRVREVGQEPLVKKATVVRDYLATHPEAKNKEIVAALTEKGVTVTPAYVSVIRGGGKKTAKKGRRLKSAGANLKDVLRQERAGLLKRMEAIDTLLG
jgi:hypothetical protein